MSDWSKMLESDDKNDGRRDSGLTPDKLYDYIMKYMTPEQALRKLLRSSIINYEKIQFKSGEEVYPEYLIALAAMELGWQIAVEKPKDGDPNSIVRGITVGTEEYMKDIFKNNNSDDHIVSLKNKNKPK